MSASINAAFTFPGSKSAMFAILSGEKNNRGEEKGLIFGQFKASLLLEMLRTDADALMRSLAAYLGETVKPADVKASKASKPAEKTVKPADVKASKPADDKATLLADVKAAFKAIGRSTQGLHFASVDTLRSHLASVKPADVKASKPAEKTVKPADVKASKPADSDIATQSTRDKAKSLGIRGFALPRMKESTLLAKIAEIGKANLESKIADRKATEKRMSETETGTRPAKRTGKRNGATRKDGSTRAKSVKPDGSVNPIDVIGNCKIGDARYTLYRNGTWTAVPVKAV